jgi:hypothetical protein
MCFSVVFPSLVNASSCAPGDGFAGIAVVGDLAARSGGRNRRLSALYAYACFLQTASTLALAGRLCS